MSNSPVVTPELVDTFVNALLNKSPNTLAAYRNGLNLAVDMKLSIDNDMVKVFAAALARRKFARATQQLYITALTRWLEWMDADDRLPKDFNRPKAHAKYKTTRGKERGGYHYRTADERLPEVIAYYDEMELPPNDKNNRSKRLEIRRAKAIMHTLYASGGRVSEIASLTRGMVADGQASEVMIVGKGDKPRLLFLTKEAQAAIHAYCVERGRDNHPALFISHGRNKGQALTRMSIWRIVKHAAEQKGLTAWVSPHAFRHYRATQLLNEGMPLESLQAYLGHASPSTTRIVYAHTKKDVLRDQLNTYGLSPKEALQHTPRE
jgi:site-specific recombinase XerD